MTDVPSRCRGLTYVRQILDESLADVPTAPAGWGQRKINCPIPAGNGSPWVQ